MSILVSDDALRDRTTVAAGPLSGLATSLAGDLDRALSGALYFPNQKARLSREGGRCARDGALLLFDPARPTEHECPECGEPMDAVGPDHRHDRLDPRWAALEGLLEAGSDDRTDPAEPGTNAGDTEEK